MISHKNKLTTVKFGSGTVGVSTERTINKGTVILTLSCIKPNIIGAPIKKSDHLKQENVEMTFMSVESIDVLINRLTLLKRIMVNGKY